MSELTDEEREYLGEPKPEPKPEPEPEPKLEVKQTQITNKPSSTPHTDEVELSKNDKYATWGFFLTAMPLIVVLLCLMTQSFGLLIIVLIIYALCAIPMGIAAIVFAILGLRSHKRTLAIITLIPYALILFGIFCSFVTNFTRFY